MRDVFLGALTEMAARRPEIMLLTGDLGFAVLDNFIARFPRQFLNVGVAEQNMTGLAAGLALEGHIVFTYSLGGFPTIRCLEQIRNDVCYHRLNVKIVSVGGGMAYGAVGPTHHATEDLAILRSLPNMTVLSPGDKWEVAQAARCLIDHAGPAYLRLDKSFAPLSNAAGEQFRLGKARVVRNGGDLTLVACGGILEEALRAAAILENCGLSCRVLSVHTVKPLDVETLSNAARETGGMVVIEEHVIEGGLGGAIAENLLEAGVSPRFFLRLGLQSCFASTVGSQQYLRKVYGLDAQAIVDAVFAQGLHLHAGESVLAAL
jgi:transketolase